MSTTRSAPGDVLSGGANATADATSSNAHLALVPTWLPFGLSADPTGATTTNSGEDGPGSGGDGLAIGTISSTPTAVFMPSNEAIALSDASANALQGNHALVNQQSTEIAGTGGNGGSSPGIGTHAGGGGDGTFFGALVSADVGVFAPVNTAVAAGSGAHAEAHQSNDAAFLQDTTQVAGIGGNAGSGYALHPSDSSGPPVVLTGDIHTGNGGDGLFIGSLTDINVAVYSPINIAVAGAGGTAHAEQDNNVLLSQGATQIAGIGGNGGGFYVPSDTIMTGDHTSGSAGNGQALGSMVDVNVSYFEPINIAVPADGNAEAQQLNHILYDQHAVQVAGAGGAAGTYHLLDSADAALLHDALTFAHG